MRRGHFPEYRTKGKEMWKRGRTGRGSRARSRFTHIHPPTFHHPAAAAHLHGVHETSLKQLETRLFDYVFHACIVCAASRISESHMMPPQLLASACHVSGTSGVPSDTQLQWDLGGPYRRRHNPLPSGIHHPDHSLRSTRIRSVREGLQSYA